MSECKSVLFVSPNNQTLDSIAFYLRPEGFHVVRANSETEVGEQLSEASDIDAAIVDLASLGDAGLSIIELISVMTGGSPIMALVLQADLNSAMEALKRGAYDYVLEPTEPEEIILTLRRLMKMDLRQNILRARQHGWSREAGLSGIIAKSLLMRERFQRLGLLARTEAPLILAGDDGVGKEFIARSIHFLSFRRFQPFVRVRCLNKSAEDMSFELFGSTQAKAEPKAHERVGAIARAHGGTLFLDEVTAVPEKVQEQIVAFFAAQESETAFGDVDLIPDVRLISATEENIERCLKANLFAKEFWQRVCGGIVKVPNLKERLDDLPEMARSFVDYYARENSKAIEGISREAVEALMDHTWPGNIRELRNIIERAVVISQNPEIKLDDLLVFQANTKPMERGLQFDLKSMHLEDVEQFIISRVLHQTRGNVSRSAGALGISRGTLYNKIKKYGLEHLVKRFIEVS